MRITELNPNPRRIINASWEEDTLTKLKTLNPNMINAHLSKIQQRTMDPHNESYSKDFFAQQQLKTLIF